LRNWQAVVAREAGRESIAPNWMLKNPRTANIIGILESARKEKLAFAGGGYNGSVPGAAPVIQNNFDVAQLVQKLDQVQQAIQDQQVIFNDRVYDNYKSKKIAIKNAANAG
jgi:hypothetical protein